MRAVHFHPQGLPLVLTAEVQDASPTHELPATLTEEGPYAQQRQQQQQTTSREGEQEAQAQAMDAATTPPPAAAAGEPAAAPGSADVPLPSASLLSQEAAARSSTHSAAGGRCVGTAAEAGSPGQRGAAADGTSFSARLDLPAAALALSGPLRHLHLQSDAAAAGRGGGGGGAAAAERQQRGASPSGRPGAPGWVPPGSGQLPPSMVPTGWELPFPSNLFSGGQAAPTGGSAAGGGAADAPGWAAAAASLPQVMAAFSAAAWNIIGEEQPPRVRLRIWRFDAARPTALLAVMGAERGSGNLRLQIPDAVLCSGGACLPGRQA
jgi:hypothetical protein